MSEIDNRHEINRARFIENRLNGGRYIEDPEDRTNYLLDEHERLSRSDAILRGRYSYAGGLPQDICNLIAYMNARGYPVSPAQLIDILRLDDFNCGMIEFTNSVGETVRVTRVA